MTPGSRRKARAAAADDVNFKFTINHEGGQIDSSTMPYVSEFNGLQVKGLEAACLKHVKSALHIASTASITMTAVWKGEAYGLASSTDLEGFMCVLRRTSMRDLEDAQYVVKVQVARKGRESKKDPDAPDRATVTALKEINLFCYREKSQGAEGEWGLDCDNVLAQQPSLLKVFNSNREIVWRAMGDGRYLLNPITGCCPFAGCLHSRQKLNALNAYWWMYSDKKKSHWLTVHKNNPAVPILIARFERLRKEPNISDARLDELAGPNPLTPEWMAEHAEDVGQDDGKRPLEFPAMKDLFNPGDISSNLARGRWVEAKKEAFQQLLVQRQADREAQAEREDEAQRARARQAMGQ